MTTSWKRTETASGAGANALSAAFCVHAWPESRLVRALRWKQDAVCRETVSADATSVQTEADPTDSSLTRTIFFSSRIQTQPTTRKETPNTTQKKKGKQTKKQVTISQETETLA